MYKFNSILSCVVLATIDLSAHVNYSLHSPDQAYTFVFEQQTPTDAPNKMFYSVLFNGERIINKSLMGVMVENKLFENALGVPNDSSAFFGDNLIFTGADSITCDTTWRPPYGESTYIRDHYNQLTLHFRKGQPSQSASFSAYDKKRTYFMDVVIRAYNEGVAFSYHFPKTSNGLFIHITDEQTQFAMPEGTMAYYEMWAQGPFHYLPLKNWPDECERPLTMHLPSGTSVSLMEAHLIDYARGKFILDPQSQNTLKIKLYDCADIISPYSTPWRVIRAAHNPADLLAGNSIMYNLNDPCSITTDWIKPGKAFRVCRLTQKDVFAGIDFAADRGLQYIELDAGWYGPEMDISSDATTVDKRKDLNLPAICSYARSKGLGVWLYVNQRALATQLDSILPRFRQWGVSGIKFGFVQVGNQKWTTWLHEAVRRCAQYHLMIDIHDEYRPTGFSRTYPNLMSQEGVGGNEEMPDARHNVTLPFTRFLAGPADYTPCYFSPRIKTTHGHQLAMSIIYYSPIEFLFWYDAPSDYHGEKELELWKQIPTVWDETFPICGEIGQYIALARRTDKTWYLGIMNGLETKTLRIPTSFLEKGHRYIATFYEDDPSHTTRTAVNTHTAIVRGGRSLTFKLLASGGASVVFSELKK